MFALQIVERPANAAAKGKSRILNIRRRDRQLYRRVWALIGGVEAADVDTVDVKTHAPQARLRRFNGHGDVLPLSETKRSLCGLGGDAVRRCHRARDETKGTVDVITAAA